jgi:hypothetical protein
MNLEQRVARIEQLNSISRERALTASESNELTLLHELVRASSYHIAGQLETARQRVARLSRLMSNPIIADYIECRRVA